MKTILLSFALALPLAARPPDTPVEPASEPTPADTAVPSPETLEAELITQPSRYVGDEPDDYIKALLSSFDMRGRTRDPFGRHQDPDFKPPTPVIAKRTVKKYEAAPVTPFSDIVEAIPITAIIPARSQFLVGGRSFGVGSRLKLNTGAAEPLTVHVVSIDASRVTFRHGTTRETADHSLKLLPGGMSRGSGIRPAGVIPAGADDTIDLSGVGSSSLSSRR